MLTVDELKSFEVEAAEYFAAGAIFSPVHFSGGNEEQLIEVFKHIPRTAWVFSTWRSHFHALLHGVPREKVMEAILDGKSMNLNFPEYRFFSSAIVGGTLPIACGVAATGCEVFCFVGDMTASLGFFQDAKKFAAGHKLPVCFVIEDNGLATNTPTVKAWGEGKPCQVKHYRYERTYPHVGLTEFVQF